MGYVIVAIIVLLLVTGFITFLVLNSTRKGGPVAHDGGAPGMGGDPSPLGDTTEHADEQADPPRPARGEERQRRDAGASAPDSPVRHV
jgi:hypothetical protein